MQTSLHIFRSLIQPNSDSLLAHATNTLMQSSGITQDYTYYNAKCK